MENNNHEMEPWEYDIKSITKGIWLADGIFGEIFRGKLLDSVDVALKCMDLADKESFMKEANIGRLFNHPNVLRTIGICKVPPIIITEFWVNGNLKRFVQANSITPTEELSVARQIASGMAYIASKGIAHCDLAARNILVGDDISKIKISDFGISKILKDGRCYEPNNNLPVDWSAPEARRGYISSAADVWSYGVVLWEVYSDGVDPYDDIPNRRETLLELLTSQNLRLCCPTKCPEIVYELMLKCWSIAPEERPSFDSIGTFLSSNNDELPV